MAIKVKNPTRKITPNRIYLLLSTRTNRAQSILALPRVSGSRWNNVSPSKLLTSNMTMK